MKDITLGMTGITAPQNGFGALPIQRVSKEMAVHLLRRAYAGGMRFYDTARAYSDSEEKIGLAFGPGSMEDGGAIREHVYIATKTTAKTPEDFREQLEISLRNLRTDYIDIYQFHMVEQCWRPGDGTGMYECMQEAKAQGKIRHIGVTTHRLQVARECIDSGLYETLQYPFSYLSTEEELDLVKQCAEKNIGFIAMKSLAGGLITSSDAAMANVQQFDNVMPIWGVQREEELDEWLAYFDEDTVEMTEEIQAQIDSDKRELGGEFCRGCGYCMPCPVGIKINNCARMSLMIRRAPSAGWLSEEWQENMKQIEKCLECRRCVSRCPYHLNTPELLKRNYEDYKRILAGEVQVN